MEANIEKFKLQTKEEASIAEEKLISELRALCMKYNVSAKELLRMADDMEIANVDETLLISSRAIYVNRV
jgi:hypothetical protein